MNTPTKRDIALNQSKMDCEFILNALRDALLKMEQANELEWAARIRKIIKDTEEDLNNNK